MVESENSCGNSKKLPFVTIYVSDRYKTHKVCDQVILESGGMLRLFLTATRIKKCVIKHALVFS